MSTDKGVPAAQASFEFVRGQGQTHRGMRRTENQDSVLVIESADLRLYAVADGMGGTLGGARASQLATSTLEEYVRHAAQWNESTLSRAFRTVHERIRDEAQRNPEYSKMGTTLVCLALHEQSLFLANVGDSRAYLIRNGKISRLTSDHTVVADLVRAGTLDAEQAKSTPISHMLTQSLGSDENVAVDTWIAVQGPAAEDKFLLCSDGLYNHVTEDEIEKICSSHPTSEAVQQLVHRANEGGGSDNVSVVLIDILAGYPNQKAGGASLALRKIEPLSASIESAAVTFPAGEVTAASPVAATAPARISVGPVQGLFFVCVAFLSGLFLGSEALVMTERNQNRPAAQDEFDQTRASFRPSTRAASLSAPKTLVDRAKGLAEKNPQLRDSLARYEAAHAEYLSHAEELLINPPDIEKEREVVELLSRYERAAAELDTDLTIAMQSAAHSPVK